MWFPNSQSSWKNTKLHILRWNFFQRPLENFLLTLRTCSRYLKGALNLAFCVSKKSWPYDRPIKKISKKTPKNPIFTRFPWHDCSQRFFLYFGNLFIQSNYIEIYSYKAILSRTASGRSWRPCIWGRKWGWSRVKTRHCRFWGFLDTATNIIVKNHLGIVWGHATRRWKAESPYFLMKKLSMS